MSGLVDGPQTVAGHVGVDLRRRQVGVAEQLLHCPQVGSSLEQVGSVRVPECVGMEGAAVGEWVLRRGYAVRHAA